MARILTAGSVVRVLRSKGAPSFFVGLLSREYRWLRSALESDAIQRLSRPFGFLSERRVQFPADELPLDILALLVSCGHAVRAEDAQALDEALRSEDTNVATATSQPPCVIGEAAEHSSPLVVDCESQSSPL
jgi:hypothetical protein